MSAQYRKNSHIVYHILFRQDPASRPHALGQLGKAVETLKERGNFSGCVGLGFGRLASTSWRVRGRVREGFADAQAGFRERPPKVRGWVI